MPLVLGSLAANVLGTFFIIICVLLILVVLLQKGRGGGLGAAFGGMGSAAFGTRIGDVLTWVTIVLTGLFLLLAIGTSMMFRTEPGKVATPEFSPEPGEIERATDVRIASPTQGSEVRFTIGETEPEDPTLDSTPYARPISVAPGMILKARAFRDGWVDSDVARAEYPKVRPKTTAPATGPAVAPSGP